MLTKSSTSPSAKFTRTRVTKSTSFSGEAYYNRAHTDLVSGHLTICTHFSTRTCFSPSRASSPYWPLQTEVSFQAHSCMQATFIKPFLTLNRDPVRDVLSQNILNRREKPDDGISKAPICPLLPSLSSFSRSHVWGRTCLARPMIQPDWRHQEMNRSPRSPTVWRVINLVIEMWAECNNPTEVAFERNMMGKKENILRMRWICVKNWNKNRCGCHTNVLSKAMLYMFM